MTRASNPDRRRSWLRLVLGQIAGWAYYPGERYVWHELDLSADPLPAPPLPQGACLRAAVAADLPALVRIGMPMLERFDEFGDRGGELCVVENDERIAAALWVFRTQMPLYPWLDLPAGVVVVEHGVTAAEQRGLGLMPAMLKVVTDNLRREGHSSVAMKIVDTNRSSLKTVAKVGFRPIALMHQVKILGTHRTVVEPATGLGRYLAVQLSGSVP